MVLNWAKFGSDCDAIVDLCRMSEILLPAMAEEALPEVGEPINRGCRMTAPFWINVNESLFFMN